MIDDNSINMRRLLTWKAALKLEIAGMKCSRAQVYIRLLI